MRAVIRLFKLAAVLLVAGIGVWFAFPSAREWPVLRTVGGYVAASLQQSKSTIGSDSTAAEGSTRALPGSGRSGDAAKKGGKGGGGPAPVNAAIAQLADMPIILTAPGTVEPLASVAVKPRVDGQIVEVAFQEGDLVKEGQVLFRFDDRLVKAQIKQAEAGIAQNEANLRDAEAILVRRETLVAKKIVTEAATETQRTSVEALKAAIAAGQAQLDMQRTQLDYLVIRAPITGRAGSLTAKLGANVRAADIVALLTINQIQPIAVSFALPQVELATLRKALAAGSNANLTIPGDTPRVVKAKMWFVDNQVDKSTGTITAKVMAENADEALWPGQAVEVALTASIRPNVVAVPAPAVLPSQQGMLTWIIGPDNRAQPREVTLERVVGDTAFVTKGLKAGEKVVTDGQVRLAPGMAVLVREPAAEQKKGAAPPTAGTPSGSSRS